MAFEQRERRINALICIGIIAATLAAYEPIRYNDFVSYDDSVYITENEDIKAGITWQSLAQAFTKPHFYMWHPLTTLSHMLDYELFGLNPFEHHLVSVLLHITNALLLFWIITNVTGGIWPGAFIAAVFALHPLQVESVAWAAERKTVISGMFWLLTMAAYIHYARRPGARRYALVLIVFGFCIMTKPVVITLPLALLLLDYWPLERIKWGHDTKGHKPEERVFQEFSVGRLLSEKIPLLVMSAILGVITYIAQKSGGSVITLERIQFGHRIANVFVSYIRYIGKLIWPSKLAVFYPREDLSMAMVILCILLFLLITIFSIYSGLRKKYFIVGWLWFLGTLVPVIGIVQSGMQAMANRYMYIPMLGLLVISTCFVKELIAARPRYKNIAAAAAGIVLLSLIITTRMQVGHWRNSLTLFKYTLEISSNNEIAENSYGAALCREGRIAEAIPYFRNAIRIAPLHFEARNNLAKALLKEGYYDKAVERFNELLRAKKDSAKIYYNLAMAQNGLKRYNEAIESFTKALELEGQDSDAYVYRGIAFLATKRVDEAISDFQKAIELDDKSAVAYINLGMAYLHEKEYEQAIQSWSKALEFEPANVEVLNSLAWLLATTGEVTTQDINNAIDYAERACELTNNERPDVLDTLAAAYAAAGRFEEAKQTAEQALMLAKDKGQETLTADIEKHLKLYKAGKRYKEK